MPLLARSALVVMLWICVMGVLHLDSADGLTVTDPQQRLAAIAQNTSTVIHYLCITVNS
jgi:cobalamin synthase